MSVLEKIENYWRGVCDPRYGTKNNPSAAVALHGGKLFDRTSRRCQSSLNIYSQRTPNKPSSNHHHHQHGLQRKLTTTAHDHGNYNNIIKLPCRNGEQHVRRGTESNHPFVPSVTALKNRKSSSSATSSSTNNSATSVKSSSSVGTILPQHENVKFTTQPEWVLKPFYYYTVPLFPTPPCVHNVVQGRGGKRGIQSQWIEKVLFVLANNGRENYHHK